MATDSDPSEREDRAAALLRQAAAGERAPARLHAAVSALYGDAEPRGEPVRRLRPLTARLVAGVGAGVGAALVLVVLIGTGAGSPTIAQAAALAARGPTAAAPSVDRSVPTRLLAVRVGNLHFPNWQWQTGWRASGERRDRLGGRAVTTVYYTAGSTRIAYSIVASPALASPAPAPRGGAAHETMHLNGRTIVVWDQRGHTCLLSGVGVPAAKLWQLVDVAQRA